MRTFHIVVAVDQKHGIGKNGTLAWQLPGDMAFFRKLTTPLPGASKTNAVIMGRKTWDSIPVRFRPLRNRMNIVISRQMNLSVPDGVVVVDGLDAALQSAWSNEEVEETYLIGGGAIYAEGCSHPALDQIFLTDVHSDFDCDTFFPLVGAEFIHMANDDSGVQCENGIEYVFKTYRRLAQAQPHGNQSPLQARN